MATDYDAPRKTEDDGNESIEALKAQRSESAALIESEDADNPGSLDLPGADLSNLELDVVVLPAQQDEFTCVTCFLVKHRSQLDASATDGPTCRDCVS